MAAAYTWHPRVGVANAKWPLARDLLEDELLSSWLIRNAFAHGCSPMVLTGHLWPRWRCWTVDIDRGLSLEHGQRLVIAAGISEADISSCTLWHIAHRISPWLVDRTATWPWVLTVGERNRRHTSGLQCCPICLEEGVPYYRLSWRLAWHTCCPKHNVRLIDSCLSCGASIQPHRLGMESSNLTKCFRCGCLLTLILDNSRVDPAALAFQIEADSCWNDLNCAANRFGGSQQWFYHSRFVWGLLRAAATHDSKAFSGFRKVFGIEKLRSPVSGLPLEMLPASDRMPFLSAVWKVMAGGPGPLYDAILESSMTRASVPIPVGDCPEALRVVVDKLPLPRHYAKERVGVTNPVTSRARVMKMWSRLKRKVLRDG